MQLIIFVQPLLPGGTMSGFGVCQSVIEAFFLPDTHDHSVDNSNINHKKQPLNDSGLQGDHAAMHHNEQLSVDATERPLKPPVLSHHSSHMSCGFCTLYGHAIPPPTLTPIWSSITKRLYITLSAFSRLPAAIIAADYIKPKSRAPPYTQRNNLYY